MMRIGPLLRRAGAGLLLVVWANIATANVAVCAFDIHLRADHTEVMPATHLSPHGDQHSTPALGARGECGVPQLLVLSYVAPQSFETPIVSVDVARFLPSTPEPPASLNPHLDPPPPRA